VAPSLRSENPNARCFSACFPSRVTPRNFRGLLDHDSFEGSAILMVASLSRKPNADGNLVVEHFRETERRFFSNRARRLS